MSSQKSPREFWQNDKHMVLVEKTEYEKLQADLDLAVKALKQINQSELNSQRPGGGYSTSARISYEILAKLKEQK